MTFRLMVSVITLAVISQDVKCKKSTQIEFIKDYINTDSSKSIFLVAFVCWDKVDRYELINRLSKNNFIASAYDMKTINVRQYHPAQNVLYLTDLDCENSDNILMAAEKNKIFAGPYKWLLLSNNESYFNNSETHFLKYQFYPDSNIILALSNSTNEIDVIEIYKHNNYSTNIVKRKTANWKPGHGFENVISRNLIQDRINLNGTIFKSAMVILHNDSFNHLHDYRFKHVDTITKVNYILVSHLIDFVNGTKDISFVNTWGYMNKTTKMFSGMIGTLQRNVAEIGGTPLFMTTDRLPIIEYVAMTTPTRAKFIFRQPPLSYVANVFTLPFSRDVWISSFALVLLASFLLYIAVVWEWRQPNLPEKENALPKSFLDSVMLTIGAVAQQGATNEPRSGAGKIIMIFTFIALMFLYVSYSANIVALLQSSATNIRTLEDLLNSRLKLGVEDTVYNHYYFETASEPIRKAIYEKKVAPKGQKPNFMVMPEGIKKMRAGFFAFHIELSSGYKLVGDTFLENEKCGLQEIEYLQVVEPYLAIKKRSAYKEILKLGLRKIHESGIQSRELQKLYTKRPECHSSGGNFVSVGLLDAYAAFLVLGFGMGLSLLLFVSEKIVHRRSLFQNVTILQ